MPPFTGATGGPQDTARKDNEMRLAMHQNLNKEHEISSPSMKLVLHEKWHTEDLGINNRFLFRTDPTKNKLVSLYVSIR